MSKRKATDELRTSLDLIRGILPQVKGALGANPEGLVSSTIATALNQLARVSSAAEVVLEHRRLASSTWAEAADELDREGTMVWNMSTQLKLHDLFPENLFPAVRLAGFRLIQAGMELDPKEDALIHVLQLASKAASALANIDEHSTAARILTSAAAYEEALRGVPHTDQGNAKANEQHALVRAQTTVLYFKARMTAAWREGNAGVASFMLQKITNSDVELIATLSIQDTISLITNILDIGKDLLRPARLQFSSSQSGQNEVPQTQDNNKPSNSTSVVDPRRAVEAIEYLQKAYTLAEKIESGDLPSPAKVGGSTLREETKAVKRATLRALARAYFFSHSVNPENLVRAETTIEELLRETSLTGLSTLPGVSRTADDNDTMRYMLLAIRRKRKSPPAAIQEGIKTIIDHTQCTEISIKSVLVEIRGEVSNRAMWISLSMHLLDRVLKTSPREDVVVGQVLLSIVFQCARDVDLQRALSDLGKAFDAVYNAGFALDKTAAAACETLLWQAGDRHHQAKRYVFAAGFFELGAHRAFSSLGISTMAKCCRKAAVCHINAHEYARAAQIVRRGDEVGQEAGTWYILFLVAVEQGVEEDATRAAERMVKAPDFDPRMLRLAMQMATERGLKSLLFAVLDLLLRAVRGNMGAKLRSLDFGVESITLVRCLIRLSREELTTMGANADNLITNLIHHLSTAQMIVEEAFAEKREAMMVKDVSWLWRTTFNLAVDGCASWGGGAENVSRLFDICAELLELYVRAVIVEADPEAWMHIVVAKYAAVCGRVFALRAVIAEGHSDEAENRKLVAEIGACKARIQDILSQNKIPLVENIDRASGFLRTLRIFEVEFFCMIGDWEKLQRCIQEVIAVDENATTTFEGIADIMWAREDCPTDALLLVLESLLHASLDAGSLSINKFSRWLRIICGILMSKGTEVDRIKAIGFVEQAATVMADQPEAAGEDVYPTEERQWLLATAYNSGLDCLQASLLDEAKRWIEASMSVTRLTPGSSAAAEKISETYRRILTCFQTST